MKPRFDTGADLSGLPARAREAIRCRLEGRPPPSPRAPALPSTGVFVTLYEKRTHELRGCVGHLAPQRETLDDELTETAVSAALHDPRFLPVTRDELDGLDVEVSLLGPEEPVSDPRALDPHRYGVIVRMGPRTGVLLPDIEGVTDVDTQLSIALRKAGISPLERYQVWRFEVIKVREPKNLEVA